MTLLLLTLGLGSFLGFFLLSLYAFKDTSAESALLEKVTRETRGDNSESRLHSFVSADRLAGLLGFFRSFFNREPDADLVRRLMLAGYRKQAYVDIFLGSKLAIPALLALMVAFFVNTDTLLFLFLALVLGFFAPDFWLGYAIDKRRERISLALPDGLDLLSICMEAGLGLDQAIVRVGQELRVSHPDLSDELLQVNLEQRAGAPRIEAWKALAKRVDAESVRSFVAMLVQTDRFGTAISKSLSAFSDSLRTQRRQQAEEKAAKTTIKLVIPLVLFIFPDVFIVTVGPAVITIMRSIGHIVQ